MKRKNNKYSKPRQVPKLVFCLSVSSCLVVPMSMTGQKQVDNTLVSVSLSLALYVSLSNVEQQQIRLEKQVDDNSRNDVDACRLCILYSMTIARDNVGDVIIQQKPSQNPFLDDKKNKSQVKKQNKRDLALSLSLSLDLFLAKSSSLFRLYGSHYIIDALLVHLQSSTD